jgi:hypothetical protein
MSMNDPVKLREVIERLMDERDDANRKLAAVLKVAESLEAVEAERNQARDLAQELLWVVEGMRTPKDDPLLEELDARIDTATWLQRNR